MAWTDKQQQAIDKRGANILVAAAAGSGKTAVLVQRIMDLILKEKVSVSNLLVVTFTNAAAAEMKDRIRQKLMESMTGKEVLPSQVDYIRNQIMGLAKASISTMHSFCIEILRRNFHHLEIDPSFKIANESTIQILKNEALDEVFQKQYESANPLFHQLVDAYGGKRNDENLKHIVLEIHGFIQSQPEPLSWLDKKVAEFDLSERSFEETSWAQAIREDLTMKLGEMTELLEDAIRLCMEEAGPTPYLEALRDDMEMAQHLKIVAQQSLTEYIRLLGQATHSRLTTITKKTAAKEGISEDRMIQVKNLRDQGKAIIKDQKTMLAGASLEQQIDKLQKLYPSMAQLAEVVRLFQELFQEKKRKKDLMDFNDLEHFALKLMQVEEVRQALQDKYQYIFFDEYQDSNLVQETIIDSVKRADNLFLVGDVKQSIYRFRLADPTIFMSRYENYGRGTDPLGLKIDLSSNFRSRKTILDFANMLFSRLMSRELGEVDYDDKVALLPGSSFEGEACPVELVLLENTKTDEVEDWAELPVSEEEWEDVDAITLEAKYVAEKVKDLLGTPWYDPKEKKYKRLGYQDMVILMRSLSATAPVFMEVLKNQGIPCHVDYNLSYFEVPEVKLLLDLLRVIDNPMQDDALLAVMRSFIGDFTAEELSQIRILTKEGSYYQALINYQKEKNNSLADKIGQMLDKLDDYRLKAHLQKLDEFIWYLLSDSGMQAWFSALPGGLERQMNLQAVVEKAAEYREMNSGGLFGFLRYVDKILKDKASSAEGKTFVQQNQVLRIMTIHKSKGLEFPVVFLCNMGKQFNKMDMKKDILLHKDLGLGPKYVNLELSTYMDSIAKKAIKIQSQKELLSEELRILYVAITRAVDRLVLVGTVPDLKKAAEKHGMKYSKASLLRQTSFLSWVLTILWDHPKSIAFRGLSEMTLEENISFAGEAGTFEMTILGKADLMTREMVAEQQADGLGKQLMEGSYPVNPQIIKTMEERFAYRYPYETETKSRAKESVTALLAQKAPLHPMTAVVELPRFMAGSKEYSPMEKGSILHHVLEVLDMDNVETRRDIQMQIDKMIEREIFIKEEAAVLDIDKLYDFFRSDLGQRMKNADHLFREEEFLLKKDEILVNGVIDCYFEEGGEWIIVDYKTNKSRGIESIIGLRYQGQMDLYREALEKSTGKKVKEAYLYLFDSGEAIRI